MEKEECLKKNDSSLPATNAGSESTSTVSAVYVIGGPRILALVHATVEPNLPWRPLCGPHNCRPMTCWNLHHPEITNQSDDG
jgi:hypothetical protein